MNLVAEFHSALGPFHFGTRPESGTVENCSTWNNSHFEPDSQNVPRGTTQRLSRKSATSTKAFFPSPLSSFCATTDEIHSPIRSRNTHPTEQRFLIASRTTPESCRTCRFLQRCRVRRLPKTPTFQIPLSRSNLQFTPFGAFIYASLTDNGQGCREQRLGLFK